MVYPPLAQAAPINISAESFVSIGLLIVVIGAAWKLAGLLTRIDLRVQSVADAQKPLETVPSRVGNLETRMDRAEEDINDLWAETRNGEGRRSR